MKTTSLSTAKKQLNMLEGPILPAMFKFAVPIILSGILQQLYSTADTLIVGAMGGKEALAAVGATGSAVSLLVTVFVSVFVGTDVLVSRYKGTGDGDSLQKVVSTTFLMSLAFGVILAVAGELLARPMMVLTDCPENIIDSSTLYLRIYFLAMPASMFANFASSVIRSSGDSRSPFVYLSISGLCNVVGNVILVLTLGDPVVAVAIATTVSIYVSASLFFIHMVREKGATRLHPLKPSFDMQVFLKTVRYGIPSAISSTTYSLTNFIIQPIINSYGDIGISGTAAAGAIEGYVFIVTQAIGTSVSTFMGQNIGANNRERVRSVLLRGYTLNLSLAAFLSVVVLSLGRLILGLFIPGEPEAIEFGYLRLVMIIGPAVLNAVHNVNRSALIAYGYTFLQMVTNLVTICLFSVLWMELIYGTLIAKTPFNFLLCYPVTWVISAAAALTIVVILTKKYMNGKEFSI